MLIMKYIIILLILWISILIGNVISKKYILRTEELKEFKGILNVLKNKIEFTYEPLPEIFNDISKLASLNTSKILVNVANKMKYLSAMEAWNESLDEARTNLNKDDLENIKMLRQSIRYNR